MNPNTMPTGVEEMTGVFLLFYGIFMLVVFVLTVVIAWRIVGKTGHPGALGLLALVPLVNMIFALYLAFSEWPIERELRALRAGAMPPGGVYPGATPPPIR